MTTIDDLRSIIDGAEAAIQREMTNGSGNPWLACFNTRLSLFRVTLELCDEVADPQAIHTRIDVLRTRSSEIQQTHNWNPPNDIKDSLMNDFRQLLRN